MSKLAADLSVVTSVGLDLAKHVFQVHAVDANGKMVVAKALRRRDVLPFFASLPPCLIGLDPVAQRPARASGRGGRDRGAGHRQHARAGRADP